MNGISKESFLKATPEVQSEMMFDLTMGLHRKIDGITQNCSIQEEKCERKFAASDSTQRSFNRLWGVVLGIPGVIGILIVIFKFVG